MQRARILFEIASESDACKAPAFLYLARLYLSQGMREKAEAAVCQGMALDRSIGEFHLVRARLALMGQDYDKADTALQEARAMENCSRLGMVMLELEYLVARGQEAEAVEKTVALLEEGMGWGSPNEVAGLGLGMLVACGALDEAENFLDQSLENDPDNMVLLIHQAKISSMRGRYRVAGLAVEKVLCQNPDHIPMLAQKAELAGRAFSHDQGLEALDRIMGLIPDWPDSERATFSSMHGDIHFDRDDLEAAENAFRSALKMDENCIPALAGLSKLWNVQGRLDEAAQLQERLYRIAPMRAMQMMVTAGHLPEDESQILRMAAAVEKPGRPLQQRASFTLSLAGLYQRRGDHDRAMDYADRANRIFRSFLRYDPDREARQADRIMGIMTREFFDGSREFGWGSRLPVFILGMPRSGTTLVEQILGSHSRIFPGGELGHIPRMWRRLLAWEYRLGSPFRRIPDCALELTREQSEAFALRVESEYRELMPGEGGQIHITDKLPHNFKNIGLIRLLFPQAPIIYCRRHPGAIALSNYFTDYAARHGGMGFAYDLSWIGSEIANCHRLMAHWIALFKKDIHVVDYEALVARPEQTVRELLDFLAISWEPGVMAFNRLERPVKTASVIQVRQPLYTEAMERWRHYEQRLTPMFKALSEGKARPLPEPAPLPDHGPSLFLRGMERLQAREYTEAEGIFQMIIGQYPRHAAAVHMLGASLFSRGRGKEAEKMMARSIRLHPGNPSWYDNLAAVLESLGQADRAQKIRERGGRVAARTGYLPYPEQDTLTHEPEQEVK